MAPTLIGAETAGDRVLVDRVAPWLREWRRYDVVAARHPLDPVRELVKRIVGLPGESIRIAEGDLFLGGRRERKSLEEIARVRVPMFRSDRRGLEGEFDIDRRRVELGPNGSFTLTANGALGAHVEGQDDSAIAAPRVATDGWEGDDGRVHRGDNAVTDLQVEVRVTPASERAALVVEFWDGAQRYVAIVGGRSSGAPQASLHRTRVPGAASELEMAATSAPLDSWAAGEEHMVLFTNFDCRLRLSVDGREVLAPQDYDEHRAWVAREGGPAIPKLRGVTFDARGGDLAIASLAIYRDLHFLSKGRHGVRDPFQLGPSQLFLLGDQSADSEDSRSFGGVDRAQCVGLVRAIVYPFSRLRRLP